MGELPFTWVHLLQERRRWGRGIYVRRVVTFNQEDSCVLPVYGKLGICPSFTSPPSCPYFNLLWFVPQYFNLCRNWSKQMNLLYPPISRPKFSLAQLFLVVKYCSFSFLTGYLFVHFMMLFQAVVVQLRNFLIGHLFIDYHCCGRI